VTYGLSPRSSLVALQASGYLGFPYQEVTRSIFYLPPPPLDGMLVHCRVTLNIKFASNHLCTCVERGLCLAQNLNTMRLKPGPLDWSPMHKSCNFVITIFLNKLLTCMKLITNRVAESLDLYSGKNRNKPKNFMMRYNQAQLG